MENGDVIVLFEINFQQSVILQLRGMMLDVSKCIYYYDNKISRLRVKYGNWATNFHPALNLINAAISQRRIYRGLIRL